MVNYKLGKIYKIVDNTNENVYIGSTCEPILARRLAKHVGDYKAWKNEKYHYVTSFKIIENENYDIQLIELFPCNSKDELHSREGHFQKQIKCVNRCIAGQTRNEYYQANSDKIKEYLQLNADKIKEQKNEKHVCLCGGLYATANKARHIKSKKHQAHINNN